MGEIAEFRDVPRLVKVILTERGKFYLRYYAYKGMDLWRGGIEVLVLSEIAVSCRGEISPKGVETV